MEHDHSLVYDNAIAVFYDFEGLGVGCRYMARADPCNNTERMHSAYADNADGAVTSWGRLGIDGFYCRLDAFLGTMITFL